MPRYAVYETQTIRVVYFVEADNHDQAHELVRDMGMTEYDDFVEALASDIRDQMTEVETPDGWKRVEA